MGEFLAGYWGLTRQEVFESLLAERLPESSANGFVNVSIGENLVQWVDAVPFLKQGVRDSVEGTMGQLGSAFVDAWQSSLSSKLIQIGDHSAKTLRGPIVSESGVYSWLQAHGSHVLQAHADFLEAVLQHCDQLLDSGDVDRFPLITMPQGRGRQRIPEPGAPRYKFFSVNGGGWVAQISVYVGASHELDLARRRLRESWLDVLPTALMESSGISISSYDLQQLGLSAN